MQNLEDKITILEATNSLTPYIVKGHFTQIVMQILN
jgi:hypothetical protein